MIHSRTRRSRITAKNKSYYLTCLSNARHFLFSTARRRRRGGNGTQLGAPTPFSLSSPLSPPGARARAGEQAVGQTAGGRAGGWVVDYNNTVLRIRAVRNDLCDARPRAECVEVATCAVKGSVSNICDRLPSCIRRHPAVIVLHALVSGITLSYGERRCRGVGGGEGDDPPQRAGSSACTGGPLFRRHASKIVHCHGK
jgi:hypothetical protein